MGWLKSSSTGIILTLGVLVLFFYVLEPAFLSPVNIYTMLRAMAYTGIIAVGMALCLISGVIDLSVGSTSALASVMFGLALRDYSVSIPAAVIMALTAGALIGLLNSFVILKMKVTPFIATISMMFVVRGLAQWAGNGYTIYPLPDGVLFVGDAKPLGISWAFWVFVAIAVVTELILRYSLLGLLLRA